MTGQDNRWIVSVFVLTVMIFIHLQFEDLTKTSALFSHLAQQEVNSFSSIVWKLCNQRIWATLRATGSVSGGFGWFPACSGPGKGNRGKPVLSHLTEELIPCPSRCMEAVSLNGG